ncbi:helix-turn-helix domain-containing protein [Escherichia coli]|nr:helix-turn-helix domain-containing protein [Escherichia coli]EFJ0225596.1 helix-turn-helix domain-containing protein [Escherichia coli]EKM3463853.1 helix-turn-helix domain-containing protein [Escherichia coli]
MGLPINQSDALENIHILVGAGALLYSSNNPELIELASNLLSITEKYSLTAANSHKQNFATFPQPHIRTQREACGLTTAELARLLNIDEEIILQWECGKGEPLASQVIPLANVLGCDPMWLLTGAYKQNQEKA